MGIEFYYNIIQLGVEKVKNVEGVVTEIRFLHTVKQEDETNLLQRLYVVPLHYNNENEELLLYSKVQEQGKDILFKLIEEKLGADQIKHMENLLTEDYNNQTFEKKQYFNI